MQQQQVPGMVPMQQQGYPQQQPGMVPMQQGYPQQQPGMVPMQQQGYPQQQPGMQQGYPQQQMQPMQPMQPMAPVPMGANGQPLVVIAPSAPAQQTMSAEYRQNRSLDPMTCCAPDPKEEALEEHLPPFYFTKHLPCFDGMNKAENWVATCCCPIVVPCDFCICAAACAMMPMCILCESVLEPDIDCCGGDCEVNGNQLDCTCGMEKQATDDLLLRAWTQAVCCSCGTAACIAMSLGTSSGNDRGRGRRR